MIHSFFFSSRFFFFYYSLSYRAQEWQALKFNAIKNKTSVHVHIYVYFAHLHLECLGGCWRFKVRLSLLRTKPPPPLIQRSSKRQHVQCNVYMYVSSFMPLNSLFSPLPSRVSSFLCFFLAASFLFFCTSSRVLCVCCGEARFLFFVVEAYVDFHTHTHTHVSLPSPKHSSTCA